MKRFSMPFAVLLLSQLALATPSIRYSTLVLNKGDLHVHLGVFNPSSEPKADILYFHGYGDRFQNHTPLFAQWTQAGYRVIAFDLPSHGGTYGGAWEDLDWFSFLDLGKIAAKVEMVTSEETKRPLFISGWSMGGLLAIRLVQSPDMPPLSRKPSGLILFAPGISVKKCVGNWACQITNDTLTHDVQLHSRRISPDSPFYRAKFAISLLCNASDSWRDLIPENLPSVVFVADEIEDKYVNSAKIKHWVVKQRSQSRTRILGLQCRQAKHELDNELDAFGGDQVRQTSIEFVRSVLSGQTLNLHVSNGPCHSF